MINCQLRMPNISHLLDYVKENARYELPPLTFNQCQGKTLSIYGAGPSLSDIEIPNDTDEAWACNSALPYLRKNRPEVKVTHGFSVDQGVEMLKDCEWGETFDVDYYVASSVHPSLIAHLLEEKRKVSYFHNYLGVPGRETEEQALYRDKTLFKTSVEVGWGLNAVPRAVCLGLALGFSKIKVYGADCAARPIHPPMPVPETPEYVEWLGKLVMYADGRTALDAWGEKQPFAQAEIDGKMWHTRPDMIISALHLVQIQFFPEGQGKIEIMGDVLPNVIKGKDAEWMEGFPKLSATGEVSGFGMIPMEPTMEEAA